MFFVLCLPKVALDEKTYQLANFMRILSEETCEVEVLKDEEDIPLCDCHEQCGLRQDFAEPDVYFWVCAHGNCMYFTKYHDASFVPAPMVLPAMPPVAEERHLSDEEEEEIGDPRFVDHPEELHKFWARIENVMQVLSPDMKEIFMGSHIQERKCVCDVDCEIVMCKVTGDIFWACAPKTCFYLQFSRRRPAAAEMDLGQIVPMGNSSIDR